MATVAPAANELAPAAGAEGKTLNGCARSTVVRCEYRTNAEARPLGGVAYLTHSIDSAKRRVRIVAPAVGGSWVARWESLRVLHRFRITGAADDLPPHAAVARDYWTQDVVDNLNRLAGYVRAEE